MTTENRCPGGCGRPVDACGCYAQGLAAGMGRNLRDIATALVIDLISVTAEEHGATKEQAQSMIDRVIENPEWQRQLHQRPALAIREAYTATADVLNEGRAG